MTAPMLTPVAFLLAEETELATLEGLDPDSRWCEFQRGERNWILQAFLRLHRAGLPVRLVGEAPPSGPVVFHARHKHELYRARHRLTDAVLVGVRGDLHDPLIADLQVLQNGRFADGKNRFFIPHWLQPGLMPRDPDRGTAIRRATYKGFDRNLHPDLRTPEWREFLSAREIAWVCDSVSYENRDPNTSITDWPDYRVADVLIAVRPPDRRLHLAKPATKLVNAWLAGVPAILGEEFAYRELRRSPLDYVEVTSIDDVRRAVRKLCDEPDLYQAMVDNGRRRALEFTITAITEHWRKLLFDILPALEQDPTFRRRRRLSLPARRALGRLQQLLGRRRSR
jgi:glycosyltransferase involved in cell wall biosynthesis